MSWMQRLYETYESIVGSPSAKVNGDAPLLPLFHTIQNVQVSVVLDGSGNYLRADAVAKENSPTIIPATEESAGRAGSRLAPHPLFDSLQYVAGDYLKWGGNPNKKKNESGHQLYLEGLQGWADWSQNIKLLAVLTYLKKGTLITDLVAHKLFYGDANDHLIEKWTDNTEVPPIFKTIKMANKKGQYEAFIRFSVEIPGDLSSALWNDVTLQQSWCRYYPSKLKIGAMCSILGQKVKVARNHPRNIRYPGDGAKLISSNDGDGFTYRGRFVTDSEACSIGIETSQKSHNALRWLIDRQGSRNGDQVIIAWAISGAPVPDPIKDTFALLFDSQEASSTTKSGYTAQEIGQALKKMIGGYSAKLGSTADVVVMGLDSATPGRMAINFYRELAGSVFLERVLAWHDQNEGCVWRQCFGKDKVFVGAPSPRDIAECAYGRRLGEEGMIKVDDKLLKATIARLLPCIVDGAAIPIDLVDNCVRRACNRQGLKSWEWEKALGIACALYRHHHKERNYKMTLETDRKTRDYLYGQLLAAAEGLESWALKLAQENRPTNAARMMQRFADHPCSTWRTIELSLVPYRARLGKGRCKKFDDAIDNTMSCFDRNDYVSDAPLTGEFLLGYHVQRCAFWDKPEADNEPENESDNTTTTNC